MKNFETVKFIAPSWALSYLINGDASGLNEDKVIDLASFESKVVSRYGNANFQLGEELGFLRHNDVDKFASDCAEVFILVEVDE